MATSRRVPTNENVSTYDSAGGKDYTSLTAWDVATAIDLVTAAQSETLECYKGAHSDNFSLNGATTNSSYYRVVRPASGEGHSGIPKSDGTVVEFHATGYRVIYIGEDYSQIQDLVGKSTPNDTSNAYVFALAGCDQAAIIGCIAYDSTQSGSGTMSGFQINVGSSNTGFVVNCCTINCDDYGAWNRSGTGYWYNCTLVNSTNGFYQSSGTAYAKNGCSSGNTNDWSGTWTKTTCTSEDDSPTYVNSSGDDFHLASGDTVCRGNGTDLSSDSNYAFDDDIDKETIVGSWSIGFHHPLISDDITIFRRRIAGC